MGMGGKSVAIGQTGKGVKRYAEQHNHVFIARD